MKICKQCGKPYTSSAYYYCSDECKRAAKLNQTTKSNQKIRNIRPQMKAIPTIRPSRCAEIEIEANQRGLRYADIQKNETIEMYARVTI